MSGRFFLVLFVFTTLSWLVLAQEKQALQVVLVEGSSFMMGSDNFTNSHEGPAHQVTISTFWMAETELSRGEFEAFVEASGYITTSERDGGVFVFMVAAGDGFFRRKNFSWKNPNFKQTNQDPAAAISWVDAVNYCNWRSLQDGLQKVYTLQGDTVTANFDANGWRLPTEAEWEYAARGGIKSQNFRYAGSNVLADVAWCAYDSAWVTHPSKQKKPNELGLYDMTGNVDEWCWDWYGPYSKEASINPHGPETGVMRVQRGGNWYSRTELYEEPRVTTRDFALAAQAYNTSGFRLVKN